MTSQPDYNDVVSAFVKALNDRGIDARESDIIADGKIHRLGTIEKPRSKDAAYLLHLDAFPAGYLENMRDGAGKQTWNYGREVAIDRAALEAHLAETKRAQSRRVAERKAEAEAATTSARAQWEAAKPADPSHPYLVRKQVGVHGLRQRGDVLLAPMRNARRDLVGLQTILPEKVDGKDKLYTKHVSTTGLYYSIGKPDPSDPIVCVCEGVATGHSIAECTGYAVAVAFDCHNLEPVTQAIRVALPTARIVVCCDDDWKQKLKNPGRVHGEAAAGAWGGTAVWPVWPEGFARRGSDFNDLHTTLGKDAVRTQIARALVPIRTLDMPKPAEEPTPTAPPETPAGPSGGMWQPTGYIVGAAGTRKEVLRDGAPAELEIAPVPVWISGVRIDAQDGTHALSVRWTERGATREINVTRGVAAVARSITALADQGFPVTSSTAALMVDYLAAAAHQWMAGETPRPVSRISRLPGWHGMAFLAGAIRHGADCPGYENPDANLTSFVARAKPVGSDVLWRDTINGVLARHPDIATVIAAMAASPLLGLLDAKPFVLDLASPSSRGKTSAVAVAATLWADPDWRIKWDATSTGIERYIAGTRDLGIVIDESQSADHPDTLIKLVYKATTDIGRVRGAPGNGTAATAQLRSVIISTGEQPLPDFGNAGGARARVLTLAGPPWGTGPESARYSAEIQADQRATLRTLRTNHGHAGQALASWLSRLDDVQRTQLRDIYDYEVQRRATEAELLCPGHPAATRLCEYAALMICAGESLHHACGLVAPHGWITEQRWRDMLERGRGVDVARSAIQRVMSWAISRSGSLYGHPDAKGHAPAQGWIGAWEGSNQTQPRLSVGVTQASDMLKAAGVQVGASVSSWVASGWLEAGNGGAAASRVASVAGASMRVWRFTDLALRQFLWSPSATTAAPASQSDIPI